MTCKGCRHVPSVLTSQLGLQAEATAGQPIGLPSAHPEPFRRLRTAVDNFVFYCYFFIWQTMINWFCPLCSSHTATSCFIIMITWHVKRVIGPYVSLIDGWKPQRFVFWQPSRLNEDQSDVPELWSKPKRLLTPTQHKCTHHKKIVV